MRNERKKEGEGVKDECDVGESEMLRKRPRKGEERMAIVKMTSPSLSLCLLCSPFVLSLFFVSSWYEGR